MRSTRTATRVVLAALALAALAAPARATTLVILCAQNTGDVAYYVDMGAGTVTTSANTLNHSRLLTFPAEITDRIIRWTAVGEINTIDRYSGVLSFPGGTGGLVTNQCRVAPRRTIE